MTDEVNEFYKGLNIDLEIVVKGLSFFIDSPEAHMCYVALYKTAFVLPKGSIATLRTSLPN